MTSVSVRVAGDLFPQQYASAKPVMKLVFHLRRKVVCGKPKTKTLKGNQPELLQLRKATAGEGRASIETNDDQQ
jgi:hypothetical protein